MKKKSQNCFEKIQKHTTIDSLIQMKFMMTMNICEVLHQVKNSSHCVHIKTHKVK